MKKKLLFPLVLALAIPLAGCTNNSGGNRRTVYYSVINGGFESGDLSGWTVEYGDAFTDDSVSSRKQFYFKPNTTNVDAEATFASTTHITDYTNYTINKPCCLTLQIWQLSV